MKSKFKPQDNEKGNALIFALITVMVLAILGSAFLQNSLVEYRSVERQKFQTEIFYLAEGAMEDTIAQFKFDIANFQTSPSVSRYPSVGVHTTVFSPSVSLPGGAVASTVIDEIVPGEQLVPDPDGINVRVKNYLITTTIQHPADNNYSLTLKQLIKRRLIYTFQHAVFYEDDLELLPGPDMTFSGRVHANSDIYIDANNNLSIDSGYLHSVGKIFNQRKNDGSQLPGEVFVKNLVSGAFEAMSNLDSESANWNLDSQTRWGGTVKSDVHGVTKLTAPSVGSINPGQFYNNNANITIVNGVITKGGVSLVEGVDIPAGTIQTDGDFYNNREGKFVRMTNIDLDKLGGGNFAGKNYPNNLPGNGLLYATRNDAGAAQPGIRLINGAEIKRNEGLTIVSNDPVYIKGNFNTVDKKPTAVICDAVNILSNNWNDSNSTNNVSGRVASQTTVNTAFISGVDPTLGGNYNGGLENYPRMHETWTGTELQIRGSFVQLWESQIAIGSWQYGNPQYKAPGRNWNYDTDFKNGAMPPFTPWAVEINKGAWWQG